MINKIRSLFFEKINKIDKTLTRFIKGKSEKTRINKIRNEREVTTNNTDIQKIKLEYYERLYDTKFNNLEKIDVLKNI